MAAENQHYVPKFILRQFILNPEKEQVRVYDKLKNTEFTTSVKNIMAERRFNEFVFEYHIASFEQIAGAIEDRLLPAYRTVLKSELLDHTPEQQAALAFFIAFQFVRTKSHRDLWKQMTDAIAKKLEAMGGDIKDIAGYEELTEDNLKKHHLLTLRQTVAEFAPIIAAKNFLLMRAPKGRSFYLGDNPVVMHNAEEHGFYGNIGLAVRGIEIYLPLSSKLVLCALCPSIAAKLRSEWESSQKVGQLDLIRAASAGKITISDVMKIRDQMRPVNDHAELLIKKFEEGGTIDGKEDQVDFINSLQTMHASRFVICKKGDLSLAKRHNAEFPKFRSGIRLSMG